MNIGSSNCNQEDCTAWTRWNNCQCLSVERRLSWNGFFLWLGVDSKFQNYNRLHGLDTAVLCVNSLMYQRILKKGFPNCWCIKQLEKSNNGWVKELGQPLLHKKINHVLHCFFFFFSSPSPSSSSSCYFLWLHSVDNITNCISMINPTIVWTSFLVPSSLWSKVPSWARISPQPMILRTLQLVVQSPLIGPVFLP